MNDRSTGPRARAILTGALLGDPAPGRTPWALPLAPNEAPRTGHSPVSDKLGLGVCATVAQTSGPKGGRPTSAPTTGNSRPIEPEKPAIAGVDVGAQAVAKGITTDDTLRPVGPVGDARQYDLAPVPTPEPLIEWMAPADLLIEGRYQRDLSSASLSLIKRITEGWDWRRFKPPVVAWTDRGFEIIDGQHTAIAAATRGITKIPTLVVEAAQVEDRAAAFLGHNRDRVAVSAVQMHRAALAAGDFDALTVQQIVDRAGANIVYSKHGKYPWKAGDTIAVAAINGLANYRGAMKARQALEALVQSGRAPIGATELRAVDLIMFGAEFQDMDQDHLPATISALGDDAHREAKLDARTHGIPLWQALGRVWFRKTRKKRKAA